MGLLASAIRRTFRAASDDDSMGGTWHSMIDSRRILSENYANAAGVRVNEATAFALSTYFACVRNISEDLGKMPRDVIRRSGGEREVLDEHPVARFMADPSAFMPAIDFWATWYQHGLAFLGGYALISRDAAGRVVPKSAILLDPSCTEPRFLKAGGMVYHYRDRETAEERDYLPEEILHIKGPSYNGVTGYSIPSVARHVLGAAMATQEFRGGFYKNGTWIGGVIEVPGALSDDALRHLRESWQMTYGGAVNVGKPAFLEEGMTYRQLGINPTDAQMNETQLFDVPQICRYFRYPLSKVQDLNNAHFANMEQENTNYAIDCLLPWAIREEQEIRRKLFGVSEANLQVKLNFKSLLRGDSQARAQFHRAMWEMGAKSANEILADEDESGIGDEGERRYVPVNMIPLDLLDTFWKSKTAPIVRDKQSIPGQSDGETEESGTEDEPDSPDDTSARVLTAAISGYQKAIESVSLRLLKKEVNEVRRANGKKNAYDALETFFLKHRLDIQESLTSPVVGLSSVLCVASGVNLPDASLIVAKYVNDHVEQSKAECREAMAGNVVDDMADFWLNVRPREIAVVLTDMVKGAVGYGS